MNQSPKAKDIINHADVMKPSFKKKKKKKEWNLESFPVELEIWGEGKLRKHG